MQKHAGKVRKDRLLVKNQHAPMKLLYFVKKKGRVVKNWVSFQKAKCFNYWYIFSKNVNNKQCAPKLILFYEKINSEGFKTFFMKKIYSECQVFALFDNLALRLSMTKYKSTFL